MTGRVFAVASGKGGVGKTTTAVNLAAVMAEADRSVVLVDYDLGMSNVGAVLDVEPAEATLHDVLAGDADTLDAVAEAPGEFDAMVGGTHIEDFGRADPSKLREVAEDLRAEYDVTIVDTGGGLSHDTTVPLGLADDVLLVSTPQVAALENTKKTLELAERVGGDVTGLILTRVGGSAVDVDEAVERIDAPLLGTIPEDGAVADSEEAGEPLVVYAPENPAAQSYRELGYELLGESPPVSFRDNEEEGEVSAGAAFAEVAGDEEEPERRSLLSRLTGGRLG
ncbi:MinD/ParA family ATP-binding protein [Halobacterium sp. KA-6]|uniref:MinD/ParA family ATP-binding protein n=1 Tax=Halobacterium sp. KA-6 TaxID=2896368 RepID=UPI001E5879FD|nr:MinD/ParA family protein [Halobacterium sp. KA-6]MCD2202899.1 MinD/ParA family protein [Halobacterium sp. KA-6]